MEHSKVVLNPFSSCSADATGKAIMALSTRTPTILMEIDTAAAIKKMCIRDRLLLLAVVVLRVVAY